MSSQPLYIFISCSLTAAEVHIQEDVVKFTDDTVKVSLLQGEETTSGPVVDDFTHWFDDSFSNLNVTKTKDMCIDFQRESNPPL